MKLLHVLIFAKLLQLTYAENRIELVSSNSTKSEFLINADDAQIGDFSHQLLLEATSNLEGIENYICGAALISNYQAITAAHCVDDTKTFNFEITAGILNRDIRNDTQSSRIKKIHMHQGWNKNLEIGNDIALLTFETPINFTQFIQPIDWNKDENHTFVGEKCFISGWGLDETKKNPWILQKAWLEVLATNECKQKFKDSTLHDSFICLYEPHLRICMGDSGGPLTCFNDGKPILVGVASWARANDTAKLCPVNYPSYYTKTSYYKNFISQSLLNSISKALPTVVASNFLLFFVLITFTVLI